MVSDCMNYQFINTSFILDVSDSTAHQAYKVTDNFQNKSGARYATSKKPTSFVYRSVHQISLKSKAVPPCWDKTVVLAKPKLIINRQQLGWLARPSRVSEGPPAGLVYEYNYTLEAAARTHQHLNERPRDLSPRQNVLKFQRAQSFTQ